MVMHHVSRLTGQILTTTSGGEMPQEPYRIAYPLHASTFVTCTRGPSCSLHGHYPLLTEVAVNLFDGESLPLRHGLSLRIHTHTHARAHPPTHTHACASAHTNTHTHTSQHTYTHNTHATHTHARAHSARGHNTCARAGMRRSRTRRKPHPRHHHHLAWSSALIVVHRLLCAAVARQAACER